jgi:hypothetical protein
MNLMPIMFNLIIIIFVSTVFLIYILFKLDRCYERFIMGSISFGGYAFTSLIIMDRYLNFSKMLYVAFLITIITISIIWFNIPKSIYKNI